MKWVWFDSIHFLMLGYLFGIRSLQLSYVCLKPLLGFQGNTNQKKNIQNGLPSFFQTQFFS